MYMYSLVLIILLGVVITRILKLHVNGGHANWKNEMIECSAQFITTLLIFTVVMTLIT
jgi:hypothetical protein